MANIDTLLRLCKKFGVKHVTVKGPHQPIRKDIWLAEFKIYLKNNTVHSVTYADEDKEIVRKMLATDLTTLHDEHFISTPEVFVELF